MFLQHKQAFKLGKLGDAYPGGGLSFTVGLQLQAADTKRNAVKFAAKSISDWFN